MAIFTIAWMSGKLSIPSPLMPQEFAWARIGGDIGGRAPNEAPRSFGNASFTTATNGLNRKRYGVGTGAVAGIEFAPTLLPATAATT
jgi:hypothetical protein